MFRSICYSLVVLLCVLSGDVSEAFFEKLFSSPCGCGRFQAGCDATSRSIDQFEKCLQCKEVKDFSDISTYFTAFFRQLPEKYYPVYIEVLKTQKCFSRGQSCAQTILTNAHRVWKYADPTYNALGEEGEFGKSARYARGSHAAVWKFLNALSTSMKGAKAMNFYQAPWMVSKPSSTLHDLDIDHIRRNGALQMRLLEKDLNPNINWFVPKEKA